MIKSILFFFYFYIYSLTAYIIIPSLQTNIGLNHKIININKGLAFRYLKQQHINAIKDDLPIDVCEEISVAKELCRSYSNFKFISILKAIDNNKDCDYMIFYRRTNKIPTVITIEGLIKIHNSRSVISYIDLLNILNKYTETQSIFLQTNELKQYNNGKIIKIIKLEKSFTI
jgi:hypothetical protein